MHVDYLLLLPFFRLSHFYVYVLFIFCRQEENAVVTQKPFEMNCESSQSVWCHSFVLSANLAAELLPLRYAVEWRIHSAVIKVQRVGR